MRVGQVSAYRLDNISGINRVILSIASGLSEDGFRFRWWHPAGGPAAAAKAMDLRPIVLPSTPGRNIVLAGRTVRDLVRSRSEIDVVHAHQTHLQSTAAVLAARILGIPSLLTFHVRVPERKRLRAAASRLHGHVAAALANETSAVSRQVRDQLGLRRCHVIPNGVPIPAAVPIPEEPIAEGGIDLVFAGRLTASKGIYELLEAIALARKRGARVRLETFGRPDEPGRYAAAKEGFGLGEVVQDFGFDPEWQRRLRPGQAFVLPSHYEGLPLSLLEAMAAGLPAVATPVGSIPDVVIPGTTGLLVQLENPRSLADAIERLARNPAEVRTMGFAGRDLVTSTYAEEMMIRAYANLYMTLGLRSV